MIGLRPTLSRKPGGFTNVFATKGRSATVDLEMADQDSSYGMMIDQSGYGHHGWYGGVKRAGILDTVYSSPYGLDRGLVLPGIAGNYGSIPDDHQRQSTAKYVDANGVVQTAPNGIGGLRDGHYITANDGETYRVALLERAYTNKVTTALGSFSTAACSITTGQADPAGGTNAVMLTAAAGTAVHGISAAPVTAIGKIAGEVWFKAGTFDRGRLYFYNATDTNVNIASVNLSTGALILGAGLTGANRRITVRDDGWVRVQLFGAAQTVANSAIYISFPASDGTATYTAAGTETIYVWAPGVYESAVPPESVLDASATLAADSFTRPFRDANGDAIAPQAGNYLYRGIVLDLPNQGTARALFVVGDDGGTGLPRFQVYYDGSATRLRVYHRNGTSTADGYWNVPALKLTDHVSVRVYFAGDGAVTAYLSINGGAETSLDLALTTYPLASAWANARVAFSGANATANSGLIDFTFQAGDELTTAEIVALTDPTWRYSVGDEIQDARVVGDTWIYADMRLPDYTPAAAMILPSKYTSSGDQRSIRLYINTTGTLSVQWASAGTAASAVASTSTATLGSVGVTDGSRVQVYATLDVDNGAAGNTVTFYWRVVGGTWAQLGDPVVTAGVTSVFNGTANWGLGGSDAGTTNLLTGTIYRAKVGTGLVYDTNTVLDTGDLSLIPQGKRYIWADNGILTVNQAGSSTAEPKLLWHDGTTYGWLPGTSGNYFSVPDEAALRVTGDFVYVMRLDGKDMTPSADETLIGRWVTVTPLRSTILQLLTTGKLRLGWSTDGSAGTVVLADSTAALSVADNDEIYVKVSLDVDNGAGGYAVKFYQSSDGVTWTQVGTTVTGGSTTSVFAGTSDLRIGAHETGTSAMLTGAVKSAKLYSDLTETTKVLDIDFTDDSAYNATQTSLTAVTGQTVTVNRSASGYKTTIVDENKMVTDGSDDYVEIVDNDRLDFALTDSFSAVVVVRQHATPLSYGRFYDKRTATSGAGAGYNAYNVSTGTNHGFTIGDATHSADTPNSPYAASGRVVAAGVRSVAADNIKAATNGTLTAGTTDTMTATSANALSLMLGRAASSATGYQSFEFTDFLLYRRALTDAQIIQLTTELS